MNEKCPSIYETMEKYCYKKQAVRRFEILTNLMKFMIFEVIIGNTLRHSGIPQRKYSSGLLNLFNFINEINVQTIH